MPDTPQKLPSRAEIVIVGGGIVGVSIAYHLTKLGKRDVVLLERKKFTSGTTWHAAGLVGQLRATLNLTRLAQYTANLYANLEKETGQSTGFKQRGSISLATSRERLEELMRGASMAKTFGLEVHAIGISDIRRHWPLINTDDVVGGVFLPKDGQTNPIDTTMALAKGARTGGATLLENIEVTAIEQKNGRAVAVMTEQGRIEADTIVLATGMWSRLLGLAHNLTIPLQACEHFYILTENFPDLAPTLPVLRDPDHCAYYKEDAGKLLLGAFEPKAKPWGVDGIPKDFEFGELPEDFDQFEPILTQACRRIPALNDLGIRKFFNGPESFTPDVRFLLGPMPELDRLFVAAGFNSTGIQSAGGAGKVLADWIVNGTPPMDLWDVDIRRMQRFQANRAYISERVSESLGLLYAMHYPYRQATTSRNVRRTPFHAQLAAQGAWFGETAGWERPHWFGEPGTKPEESYSWFGDASKPRTKREHMAVRQGLAAFDVSSYGKIMVEGRDALAALSSLCANNIDVPVGQIVYTQCLNPRGGIEADVTITRMGERKFFILTAAGTTRRDVDFFQRSLEATGQHVFASDVSSGWAGLAIMGPKSRDFMSKISGEGFGNEEFPFGAARLIEIGAAPVWALRLTYVGSLGWEIWVPTEFAGYLFDRVAAAAAEFGLVWAGMHAMDSCRVEKIFPLWGKDLSDEVTPFEAGIGFAVSFDAARHFIGRDALLRQRESGIKTRLVQFAVSDTTRLLYKDEPIWQGEHIVGRICSGNYGYAVGRAVGLGFVELGGKSGLTEAAIAGAKFDLEIAGDRIAASAHLKPIYDPEHKEIFC
ncbi:MAG: FAD-dependent oxidoreductase [Alphaproteobacteria bacterium]|nr:FAD-dependent oxidoreductase [Alphaproteobacteria bacterium]